MHSILKKILSALLVLAYGGSFASDTLSCPTISMLSPSEFLQVKLDADLDDNAVLCFIRKFETVPQDFGNHLEVVRKSNELYWHYFNNFEFNKAIPFKETLAHYWQEKDSTKQYNKSIHQLAICHYYLGSYDKSFELLQESIKLASIANDEERLMLSYYQLSWLMLRFKRYDEAIEANKIFFDYVKKLNSGDQFMHNHYYFLSNLYRSKNDILKAKYFIDSSLHFANQARSDKLIALSKSSKSMCYEGKENLLERISLVNEALAINKRNNNIREVGTNYSNLGELYNLISKNDSIYKYFNLALKIQKSIGDEYQEYITHEKLSHYFERSGNNKKAYFHQDFAAKMYWDLFGARETAKIHEIEKLNFERKIEATKLKLEKQNAQIELELLKNNQKKLFLFLTSLFVIGLLYLYYYRYRNIQKLKKLKLKKEAEKEIINLRKQAIRSQLNPHFLFNNLNSIKSYIAGNEPRNATRYLNKFALLMRNILNNSIKEKVSLNEEIEALKLFIEIERYRLKTEIDLEVELDENIDYNLILVSPSILQPFVENGIFQYHKDHIPLFIKLSLNDTNQHEIVVNIQLYREGESHISTGSEPTDSIDSKIKAAYDIKDQKGNLIGSNVSFTISKKG